MAAPKKKPPPGLRITRDSLLELKALLQELASKEVLVGFPEENADRDDPGKTGQEPTNAMLGFIHDKGEPASNIPARPFMIPGMKNAEAPVTRHLLAGAKKLIRTRDKQLVETTFERAGLAAATAIKRKINEGVPPPLSEVTLRKRAQKGRKGAKEELERRAQGLPPGTALAKPLIDTAQMRNAVNYVVRARKERKA